MNFEDGYLKDGWTCLVKFGTDDVERFTEKMGYFCLAITEVQMRENHFPI